MPVQLSKDFANRLAENLRKPTALASPTRRESLFYKIRPAITTSNWTLDASGILKAAAVFLDKTATATPTAFSAFDALGSATSGSGSGSRFYAIWRGRWERISGAEQSPQDEIGVGTLAASWTQNATRDNPMSVYSSRSFRFHHSDSNVYVVQSPLSRPGDALAYNSTVLFVLLAGQNSGYLLNAECPV